MVQGRHRSRADGRQRMRRAGFMRWFQGVLMFVISAGLLALTAHLVGTQTLLAGGAVLTPWTILVALVCGLVATGSQAVRWRLFMNIRGTSLLFIQALAVSYSVTLLYLILTIRLCDDISSL